MAERVQINEIAKPQYTSVNSWEEMDQLIDQGIVVEQYRHGQWQALSPTMRPGKGWWQMAKDDGIAIRRSPNLKYGLVRMYLSQSAAMDVVITKRGWNKDEVMSVSHDPQFKEWLSALIWFTIDEKVIF